MGEITDIITLYIKESNILEDEAKKISNDLEDNIKDIIGPGKVGYDTGHLHDSIISKYNIVSDNLALVTGWYLEDYGQYWYRWKGGTNFLSEGLQKTVDNYK